VVTTRYEVDAQRVFKRAIDEAKKNVGDLTVPLRAIAEDFYASERGLFEQPGPGGYSDLSKTYKIQKKRDIGAVYPILVRSGLLKRSVTKQNDPNAFMRINERSVLLIGSTLPYAGAVAKKRPYLFIGPEASRFATSEQISRLDRWLAIMREHVLSVMGKRAA
jgi:hypothetical protein